MADPHPLDPRDLRAFYRHARQRSRYDELFVRVLANTGMRVNEFAHMQAGWVDFAQRWVHIPPERPCDCSECEGTWTPKTGAGDRDIPIIDERTFALLRAYFRSHSEIDRSRWTVYRHCRDMGEEIGLEGDMHPHRLRHTYATRLATWKADPYVLKEVMGWGTLETAVEYIELAPSTIRDEIESIWGGARLDGISPGPPGERTPPATKAEGRLADHGRRPRR